MTIWINESGVRFGPFEECDIFIIENSPTVSALGEHLKKVEFLLSMPTSGGKRKTVFLEAKSTIPRERDAFFNEVKEKMLHSLATWFMALVGKHGDIGKELPEALSGQKLIQDQIDLILVIPPIPDTHLSDATDKFRAVMMGDIKAWGILPSNVRVLNISRAKAYGVISP
ncbi:hypothetical protein PZ739_19325 [Pseudomonas kermanshahensis]|uniref:hypothetical protein n=1 Tax=Pseudomonas kermanshahensis TaxID=2745482 RepID=UPI0023DB6605|nr:hypothetical protein [Pseudomonas kermanshahensis]WEL53973.1 hypothetical protein PZ739_19325 [Pseudomonas kermanshahensis]